LDFAANWKGWKPVNWGSIRNILSDKLYPYSCCNWIIYNKHGKGPWNWVNGRYYRVKGSSYKYERMLQHELVPQYPSSYTTYKQIWIFTPITARHTQLSWLSSGACPSRKPLNYMYCKNITHNIKMYLQLKPLLIVPINILLLYCFTIYSMKIYFKWLVGCMI
jgi:hypothetical protein